MMPQVAEEIEEAAKSQGFEINRKINYSGRGMMGHSTTALTFSDLGSLLEAVARAAHATPCIETFAEAVKGVSVDKLGDHQILY
jgi:hypothetical protein